MPAEQVAACLDKVIEHCKDLAKTGCFGGWSNKVKEVRWAACMGSS